MTRHRMMHQCVESCEHHLCQGTCVSTVHDTHDANAVSPWLVLARGGGSLPFMSGTPFCLTHVRAQQDVGLPARRRLYTGKYYCPSNMSGITLLNTCQAQQDVDYIQANTIVLPFVFSSYIKSSGETETYLWSSDRQDPNQIVDPSYRCSSYEHIISLSVYKYIQMGRW